MKNFKILCLIFPLIIFKVSHSASIKVNTEDTELVPDVTSTLINEDDSTTEIERTKKEANCFETKVNGKSVLQCADSETSPTLNTPAFAPLPGLARQGGGFPGFEHQPLDFPSFNNIFPTYKVSSNIK